MSLRRDTDKAKAFANRRTRLRSRSPKALLEQPLRDEVRAQTIMLAGGVCQARGLILHLGCSSTELHDMAGNPVGEVHEVIRRSRRPGAHLDVTLTVYLCWLHHHAVTVDERLGRSAGLCWRSYEVDEARAAVAAIRAGLRPEVSE